MTVNWKVRFKNKVWLASFLSVILTFVYTVLGMFDIYPEVTKNDVGEVINSVLMFLSMIGVIVDPTTAGLNDSKRAMNYEEPYNDDDHPEQPEDYNVIPEENPEVISELAATDGDQKRFEESGNG